MNIILLGAPGAGKGTQAANIIEKYSAKRVATGDMLRSEIQNQTPIGLKVKEIMAAGQLVSEEIILEIVKNAIANEMNKSLLFDGFPRTVNQAQFLSKLGIPIDYVIEIHVPDEDIINRLGGRWVHPASGRVYHEVNNPPLKKWYDDKTNELLEQRDDDKPETIRKRLTIYHETTAPVVQWYRDNASELGTSFHRIDGQQPVNKVFTSICGVMDNN